MLCRKTYNCVKRERTSEGEVNRFDRSQCLRCKHRCKHPLVLRPRKPETPQHARTGGHRILPEWFNRAAFPRVLYVEGMPAIMFRCPNTGRHVHEWFADDAEYGDDTYHSVTCLACQQVRMVNPTTGKVLGVEEE